MLKKMFSLMAALLISVSVYAQVNLTSDPAHSRIQFTVTHLGINDITGSIDTAEMTVKQNAADFLKSAIGFTADVNTINTHVEARDKHLRSADFFDVENHPKMIFVSTGLKKMNDHYALTGTLTMHGVTKPVTLKLIDRGSTVNQMNKKKTYAYQVLGTINRSDFGVGPKFPAAVISDEVRIKGDFELTEK